MKDFEDAGKEMNDQPDRQVQNILNAMKHPDLSSLIEESREIVYDEVKRKINSDPVIVRSRRRKLIYYISIASVIALLFVPISVFIYRKGYDSAVCEIAQSNIEIQAPFGTKSCLTLPDGTEVILNGGSKLVYPASFMGERHVTLSGEGFFDVAEDAENPFFVHSEHLSLKVLGTSFNLKAYKEDKQTSLTLCSGRVTAFPDGSKKECCISLEPNQQLMVNNETKQIQRNNVDAEKYIAWKDNILVFQNQTIQEIAVTLERHFGIKINIVSEKIGQEHYTALFKHGESLEDILNKLSYKRRWKFEKSHCGIEIKNN